MSLVTIFLMKINPAKVYYKAGNDFLKRRDFPKAIASYKDAIRFYPQYFKAYCNLGVAYKGAGLYKDAETTFKKALKLKPNSAVIYNNLGNVYTSTNRLKEAEWFYQKALKIYPNYKNALYNLGQVYYFTGEKDKALETRIALEKLKNS